MENNRQRQQYPIFSVRDSGRGSLLNQMFYKFLAQFLDLPFKF